MNTKEKDMRYPSIDELGDKTTSKYKLVMAVSKRAIEIDETHKTYLEQPSNKKSIGIALEEIYFDKVVIK